jgi:hypothetical protein
LKRSIDVPEDAEHGGVIGWRAARRPAQRPPGLVRKFGTSGNRITG